VAKIFDDIFPKFGSSQDVKAIKDGSEIAIFLPNHFTAMFKNTMRRYMVFEKHGVSNFSAAHVALDEGAIDADIFTRSFKGCEFGAYGYGDF
jgi:hypothetical protein